VVSIGSLNNLEAEAVEMAGSFNTGRYNVHPVVFGVFEPGYYLNMGMKISRWASNSGLADDSEAADEAEDYRPPHFWPLILALTFLELQISVFVVDRSLSSEADWTGAADLAAAAAATSNDDDYPTGQYTTGNTHPTDQSWKGVVVDDYLLMTSARISPHEFLK
jgi:hypothetical protein